MGQAYICRRGGGGKGVPFLPFFSGKSKLVLLNGGKAGYMEFYTSGTLTWKDDKVPPSVDLFCVGGGGAGASASGTNATDYSGGGGGSGYTTTVLAAQLPLSIEIIIGAGGGAVGGTTSIGTLCSAEGGKAANGYLGGNGGSGGGNGRPAYSEEASGYGGGSNGASVTNGGTGQGRPTTDLLGRIHAGGGGGAGRGYPKVGGAGGASDFTDGKGQDGTRVYDLHGKGGGGYGGGGGGGTTSYNNWSGGAGGQGFAMIAWGDYASAKVR